MKWNEKIYMYGFSKCFNRAYMVIITEVIFFFREVSNLFCECQMWKIAFMCPVVQSCIVATSYFSRHVQLK